MEREQPRNDNHTSSSSPVTTLPGESPIKPIGPSCPMCYNGMQCTACKLDTSYVSSKSSGSSRFIDARAYGRRSRPFSITSGTTLIGDHENHHRF